MLENREASTDQHSVSGRTQEQANRLCAEQLSRSSCHEGNGSRTAKEHLWWRLPPFALVNQTVSHIEWGPRGIPRVTGSQARGTVTTFRTASNAACSWGPLSKVVVSKSARGKNQTASPDETRAVSGYSVSGTSILSGVVVKDVAASP